MLLRNGVERQARAQAQEGPAGLANGHDCERSTRGGSAAKSTPGTDSLRHLAASTATDDPDERGPPRRGGSRARTSRARAGPGGTLSSGPRQRGEDGRETLIACPRDAQDGTPTGLTPVLGGRPQPSKPTRLADRPPGRIEVRTRPPPLPVQGPACMMSRSLSVPPPALALLPRRGRSRRRRSRRWF